MPILLHGARSRRRNGCGRCRGVRWGSSGRGRSWGVGPSTRAVEAGARDDVGRLSLGCLAVDVDGNAGVGGLVPAREGDELISGGSEASATGNLDLCAFRVELLSWESICQSAARLVLTEVER